MRPDNLATWTSNLLTSSPQRALRSDENDDRGKFELVLKTSLERPKRKILSERTFFCAKNLLFET